jgi:hypothetical protein
LQWAHGKPSAADLIGLRGAGLCGHGIHCGSEHFATLRGEQSFVAAASEFQQTGGLLLRIRDA